MTNMFHYIAVAVNQNTSGKMKTKEEAITWATDQLTKKPTLTEVVIYHSVSLVERDTPPITVRDILVSTTEDPIGLRRRPDLETSERIAGVAPRGHLDY